MALFPFLSLKFKCSLTRVIKCRVVIPMYVIFAYLEAVNLYTTHDDSETGVGALS